MFRLPFLFVPRFSNTQESRHPLETGHIGRETYLDEENGTKLVQTLKRTTTRWKGQ